MRLGSAVVAACSTVCLVAMVSILSCPANNIADDKPDETDKPTIKYDEILELGSASAGCLRTEAEAALRSRRFDRARHLVACALSKNPDDIDSHKVYAEALEGTLSLQRHKDPQLFTKCVEEWLLIMRSQAGEEKGLNFKGVGVADFFFKDDDGYILARQHLIDLTGSAPHPWETNKRYLKRALKPANTLAGIVIPPDSKPHLEK